MKSTKYQLKNGLKVILLETHKSPVISAQMWVKNGSADEKKGEEGLSHFIEHLVFKGSGKYKTGEIAQIVEGSGGELNAYTTFDQTVFYVTISNKFTDLALDVIGEMMGSPLFDPIEVNNEREVVIEEIKMGMDSPGRRSSQLLFSTCYKKHPYGIPVIGYEKVIKKVSLKKIKEFYQERYAINNMLLVVAGDFETKKIKKNIYEQFSKFKKVNIQKRVRTKDDLQKNPNIKIANAEFQHTSIYFSWKIPAIQHNDIPALDVLAFILGQGDSSRLVKDLRINKALTNSIGSWTFTPQDKGLFSISMNLHKETIKDAIEQVGETVFEFLKNGPNAEELQKAITNFSSDQVYSIETVDGVARKAGSLEFFMNDYKYFEKFLKIVTALKPEDILKVGRKYLKLENLNISVMTNEDVNFVKNELRTFLKSYKSNIVSKKLTTKIVKFKPLKLSFQKSLNKISNKIIKKTRKSGIVFIGKKNNDIPAISLRIGFHGGVRGEFDSEIGLSELFSKVWLTTSANFSETELNKTIDEMAAGLSTFSGRNTFGLSADFLKIHQDKMFEIILELLLNPSFNEDILKREKIIQGNQIKSRQDSPSQLCGKLFIETIFPNHPMSRDILGSQSTLDKIQQCDLHLYFEKLFSTKNMYVSIVGDFDQTKVENFLKKLENKMSNKEIPQMTYALESSYRAERHHLLMDKEQTHVIVGYRGLNMFDNDKYVSQIIQSILAGQGGRLFIELRDKKSLAYSVSPMKLEGIEGGYFAGYIACSPDKVEKAIEMLQYEFKKMATELVSLDELNRSRNYLIGRHDIDLQKSSAQANMILFDEIYGLDCKKSFEIQNEYNQVTPQDILRVAKKIFSSEPVIITVGK